jgi:hypothetical protein
VSAAEHAPIAPSSLYRLVDCTGSFDMCHKYPEREDSPASMEGTAAHWVASQMLNCETVIEEGMLAPNGVAVTAEMIEGAELYTSAIPSLPPLTHELRVEERLVIPTVHPTECWGTPDLWWFSGGVLHVVDYKFGHLPVEVAGNPQLAAYASGAAFSLGLEDCPVHLTIVQPRCFHRDGTIRTWKTTLVELAPAIARLRLIADRVLNMPELTMCETGSHCRGCSAAHACEALQTEGAGAVAFSIEPVPSEMDNASKGLYLSRVKSAMGALKAIESGLEAEIENSIRNGENVPGWEFSSTPGRVAWSKPVGEVVALGALLGVEFRKDGVVTPTQAKAALKKKGVDETVIFGYSVASSGSLKLTPTDKTLTRRVFGTTKE